MYRNYLHRHESGWDHSRFCLSEIFVKPLFLLWQFLLSGYLFTYLLILSPFSRPNTIHRPILSADLGRITYENGLPSPRLII
jgi:hypothetical protein